MPAQRNTPPTISRSKKVVAGPSIGGSNIQLVSLFIVSQSPFSLIAFACTDHFRCVNIPARHSLSGAGINVTDHQSLLRRRRSVDQRGCSLPEESKTAQFETIALPHFGAAYNLARWLVRDDHDAEDVVQEAYMRAFRFFGNYRGGDSRSWLLTIVRNTCYTWLQQNRAPEVAGALGKTDEGWVEVSADPAGQPEVQFIRAADRRLLQEALELLPAEFREALVLRELEGLSYKEIADIT